MEARSVSKIGGWRAFACPGALRSGILHLLASGEECTMARLTTWALALVFLSAGAAVAQQPVFYPAQGQSPQQQSQDRAACQTWAAQQTGAAPGAPAAPPPRAGGRARGAAAGAAGAAITGNDPGKGAAAGAVGGAAAQRGARRQDRRQAAAQQQQTGATSGRAMAACMQGKGYAVQ
jgi:hypothetical protein